MRLLPLALAAALAAPAAFGAAANAQPAAAAAPSAAEFLAKTGKEPGVITLPSGLEYKVVASGPAGPSPKPGDVVKVHYEGKLTNGQVFDSSFARGKPVLMPLEGLVQAWMELRAPVAGLWPGRPGPDPAERRPGVPREAAGHAVARLDLPRR
jgi:hypothetical protein